MDCNVFLVMVDECGDEVYTGSWRLALDLDEDEFDIWKERKIAKASEQYPEARGFYFEDRRMWNAHIVMDMRDWF